MNNIPNILSLFRLCLVPVFVGVYFSSAEHANIYGAIVYVLASLTDMLDGKIARKYHVESALGKILDPLGDKLMTCAVLVCITISGVVPLWVIITFVAKEACMGIGGLLLYKRLSDMPPSNIFGKCSTVVFFIVCSILMICPSIPNIWVLTLAAVAIGVMFAAFISYVIGFVRLMRKAASTGQ